VRESVLELRKLGKLREKGDGETMLALIIHM